VSVSASEKLKTRLFGESQYEVLDVNERTAVVAVVEAAEVSAERIVELRTMGHAPLLAALRALETALEGER